MTSRFEATRSSSGTVGPRKMPDLVCRTAEVASLACLLESLTGILSPMSPPPALDSFTSPTQRKGFNAMQYYSTLEENAEARLGYI